MHTSGLKQVIKPADGKIHPLPWPYSHGIAVGNLLFIAGQVALDEDLRLVGPGDIEVQARQAWENIRVVVEAAGGKVTDVVRVTTYLADLADVEGLHKVRREIFPDGDFPVATVTEAKRLGLPGLLVEIEATAVIGST